jgi:hypothetical protein
MDTQPNPGVARGLALKALDEEPYAIIGPGYSGSVKVPLLSSNRPALPTSSAQRPRILHDVFIDDKGDLDCDSFMAK